MTRAAFAAARMRLPDAPALVVGARDVTWVSPSGETERISFDAAAQLVGRGAWPFVCHRKAVARRLGCDPFPAYDLLELFAFVRPARFCVPTARGLAIALLLPTPHTLEGEAEALFAAARALLAELTASPREGALPVARIMARAGWPWGPAVLSALGAGDEPPASGSSLSGFKVWNRLKEWEDRGPEPPPDSWPVEPVEARARLVQLLGSGAEPRPQQMLYASHTAAAFAPRNRSGEPQVVLAEAGTGIGKTLGYIAPASVWVQKNHGSVWISTYTRNLQRQLDRELDRAYPNLRQKSRKVVVRKGRENALCLLNFEELALRLIGSSGAEAVALGLVARWATATRDGDMVGGDFPGWLADLLGRDLMMDLTDTRRECIYAACRHYRKCFIERSIRRARRAEIVVANHALVMVQAARGDDPSPPIRYVFDEGHHLFDAADAAFSLRLSGRKGAELRLWLTGAEDRRRSRRRGLKERLGDLIADDEAALAAVNEAVEAARILPGPGWRQRLATGLPLGPTETFLALIRQQVHARSRDIDPAYSLETAVRPSVPGLIEASCVLDAGLARLRRPLTALIQRLGEKLDAKAAELDTYARQRIEGLCRGLERRAAEPIAGWQAMLRSLDTDTPADFVDWFGIERLEGREVDVGFHRHFVDPMRPFADLVLKPAHGTLITSATLRDASGDEDADWAAAEQRTGVCHLSSPPVLSALPSPFDYARLTRVLVVVDVDRDDPEQVAAAYRELLLAAGGGALGLFTAISRLRSVYHRIAAPLEAAGLRLLAQHVDALDTGTLIDIFRAEDDACLLGTDAVRDGIDVPGRSLRLIVFDRVPWPRPDIRHRVRRQAFGGRAYDEMLTRLKLKQAFGRLVRRADDRGVFVMLDRALPSRLAGAFPQSMVIERVGLKDAIAGTRAHLGR